MKRKVKAVVSILMLMALVVGTTACGSQADSDNVAGTVQETVADKEANTAQAESQSEQSKEEVTTIQVTFMQNNKPLSYEDENGNPTGYEVEVLKLVDEALPQYEFEYTAAAIDAEYTGLSSGLYDIALSNAFYTVERNEKYIIPENQSGASPIGILTRTANSDANTLEAIAAQGLAGAPLLAGNGLTYVVESWNEENDPDLLFEYTDSPTSWVDAFDYILTERYDWTLETKVQWETYVVAEDGPYHDSADQLSYTPVLSVPTYTMINKDQVELAGAVDEVLGQLKAEGTLEALAIEYLGFNTFDVSAQ